MKNKGQAYPTSLLTSHVLQYVKQRNEKVATIRQSASAIHRITGSHKQANRSTSTAFNRRANGTNQFHID
ncbi:hypothetical protein [Priestia megaterium]|uniref:hypothetical protein n=1 Tax=Priestia megaterium TaxID=1404 RepID=UPI0027DCC10F|nr:hypothetical protein [Priestia megaterium]